MDRKLSAKIVVVTEWFAYLAGLNLLWLLLSLPLITVFPATNALFKAISCIKDGDREEIFLGFWKTFKENSIKVIKRDWLIGLVGVILMGNIFYLSRLFQPTPILQVLLGANILLCSLFFVFSLYLYSLFQQKEIDKKEAWLLAFYYSMKHPFYSIGLLLSCMILFLLFLFWPAMSFFFSASLPAFLGTTALIQVMD